MTTTGSRVYPALPPGAATDIALGEVSDATGLPGEAAPARALQAAGADESGILRVPFVDGSGAVAVRPDIRGRDFYGFTITQTSLITAYGYMSYLIDPSRWSSYTTGGGSIGYSSTTGEALLTIDGAAGAKVVLVHNHPSLYSANHGTEFYLAFRVTAPLQANQRWEWGGTSQTGASIPAGDAFGFYLEDGVLGIFVRLPNTIGVFDLPQSQWNVDKLDGTGPSGLTMTPGDLVNATIYQIVTDWKVIFKIGGVVVQIFDFADASRASPLVPGASPPFARPYLYGTATGATGPCTVACGCSQAESLGRPDTIAIQQEILSAPTYTIPSGASRPIGALRAAALFEGLPNGKRMQLRDVGVLTSQPCRIRVYYGRSADVVLTSASFAMPANVPEAPVELDESSTAVTIGSAARSAGAWSTQANVPSAENISESFPLLTAPLCVYGDGDLPIAVIVAENLGASAATVTRERFTFGVAG